MLNGSPALNQLSHSILGCCLEVHRALGPGLLESAYRDCVAFELSQKGLSFEIERSVPLVYKGRALGIGLRLDILVQDTIVLEIKAVEKLNPIHTAQILTYMKLLNKQLGLLVNFNTEFLQDGIHRVIAKTVPFSAPGDSDT
jgi:GxxExxY protein